MLRDIVTGKTRKAVYVTYALIGFAIGTIQVSLAAVDAGTPEWLKVALAVFGYAGVALGFTASANVDQIDPDMELDPDTYYAPGPDFEEDGPRHLLEDN